MNPFASLSTYHKANIRNLDDPVKSGKPESIAQRRYQDSQVPDSLRDTGLAEQNHEPVLNQVVNRTQSP